MDEREKQLREIAAQRTAIGIPTTYEDLVRAIEGPEHEPRGSYPCYAVKHEGPNRRARRDMKFGRPNEFGWRDKDY